MPKPPSLKLISTCLVLATLLWFIPQLAEACPMCKEALSSLNPTQEPLTQAWSKSIALLMGTPYILFGGITFWIIRSARRKNRDSSA